jgi:hypothetical protein
VEEVIEGIGEVLAPAQRATFARLYGDLTSPPASRGSTMTGSPAGSITNPPFLGLVLALAAPLTARTPARTA